MTESEVWKDVVGFEGLYQVSNKGNIYSVERRDSRGYRCGGRMLTPAYNSRGYLNVNLSKNGKSKTKKVHRLVAETFIPNPKGFLEINHKDENKSNNRVENLEWCTREYNNTYGTRIERTVQKQLKKVRAVNNETGEVVTFNSVKEAGYKGHHHCGAISMACRGVYKGRAGKLIGDDGCTYKGFRWSYEVAEENEGE